MKRLILLFLCALLLCGCGMSPADSPLPQQTQPPITPVHADSGESLRDPQHELEVLTGGALRAYPLGQLNANAVTPLGNDLLLFSDSGLIKIQTDRMQISSSYTASIPIFPDDPSVQVSEKGVTYFSAEHHQLIFLDSSLKEVHRLSLPGTVTGTPALSADRKQLYYFTSDALRALNLDTGLDRLIREMSYPSQIISGLHRNDQVLEYLATDQHSGRIQAFLDVTTGELLYQTEEEVTLSTYADRYFATAYDGYYQEKLTGSDASDVMMIYFPHLQTSVFPLLEQNAVAAAAREHDTCILDYYSLADGTRAYSLTVPERWVPVSITADRSGNGLWVLIRDTESQEDILCQWSVSDSVIEDDTVYVGLRRTADNPDEYGLQQCADLAREISDTYQVEVLLWQQALQVQPWDYYLIGEYQVLPIRNALTDLQKALGAFPEDFFRKAAASMGDGILRISLVRGIYGNADSGALNSATGLQFWEDETDNPYLCIQIGYGLEQTLYHELFHVLESRVYSKCDAYDKWNRLNPSDFTYDFNYSAYLLREDQTLITGNTRAFIDLYSMTFPKEDRARIMEYACTPDHSEYFMTETMQQKLLMLCTGIRQAYGLQDVTEPFLWEQYLDTPLAPAK